MAETKWGESPIPQEEPPIMARSSYGDVLPNIHKSDVELSVVYNGSIVVKDGVDIAPTEARSPPHVQIGANLSHKRMFVHVGTVPVERTFALACVDPDGPSPDDPIDAQWLHWLVVNIAGGNLNRGDVLCEYMGPSPPKGRHRYIFALFEQPPGHYVKVAKFTERAKFNIMEFARRNHWGDPIAATYFISELDVVPELTQPAQPPAGRGEAGAPAGP